MMTGVKIPLLSLSATLSIILKLQTDETQFKRNQKRKLLLFLASFLYNSITFPCQLSSLTSLALLLPLDMIIYSYSTPLLHPSISFPRLLLFSEPAHSCPKSTLDPSSIICKFFSCCSHHRPHPCLR